MLRRSDSYVQRQAKCTRPLRRRTLSWPIAQVERHEQVRSVQSVRSGLGRAWAHVLSLPVWLWLDHDWCV